MSETDKNWTPEEVAAQLKKPTGAGGLVVAENMQKANKSLYDMVFAAMPNAENQKILEIGFGNGAHFSRYFENFQNRILFGLDFSKDMCDVAKNCNVYLIQKDALQIIHGTADTMPYEDDFFDCIVAINTIYFWEPLHAYLKEIWRVLKPGGVLLLGFRDADTLQQLEFTKTGFVYYTIAGVETELQECGFSETKSTYENSIRESINGQTIQNKDICTASFK